MVGSKDGTQAEKMRKVGQTRWPGLWRGKEHVLDDLMVVVMWEWSGWTWKGCAWFQKETYWPLGWKCDGSSVEKAWYAHQSVESALYPHDRQYLYHDIDQLMRYDRDHHG